MQKAIDLIDRRISAHRGAIETLESLRAELAAEASAERPSGVIAPAAPAPPPIAPRAVPSPVRMTAAAVAMTVPGLGPLPAPRTPVRTGKPGRPPNPASVRRDPPPPPGLSMRDRILEAVTVSPMTSGELVARMPGVMPNSVYSELAKMRKGGVLAMWEDPADGLLKNRLMSTMVAEMVAAEPPAEGAA